MRLRLQFPHWPAEETGCCSTVSLTSWRRSCPTGSGTIVIKCTTKELCFTVISSSSSSVKNVLITSTAPQFPTTFSWIIRVIFLSHNPFLIRHKRINVVIYDIVYHVHSVMWLPASFRDISCLFYDEASGFCWKKEKFKEKYTFLGSTCASQSSRDGSWRFFKCNSSVLAWEK